MFILCFSALEASKQMHKWVQLNFRGSLASSAARNFEKGGPSIAKAIKSLLHFSRESNRTRTGVL